MENTFYYNSVYKCEPFMTKRKLYNSLSKYENSNNHKDLMNVLSMCDGKTGLDKISNKCNLSHSKLNITILLCYTALPVLLWKPSNGYPSEQNVFCNNY